MNQTATRFSRTILLFFFLYCFFLSLDLIGLSFKLFGKEFAQTLIETTTNPFVGLLIGILATTLVQSSSTSTSMTVGLVAADALTIEGAIPIIMGANIGTTVTNTLVSLAHVTRPEEFRRAFSGATLHDFFNWLAVFMLLPLEIQTGYLSKSARYLEGLVEGVGGIKLLNPVKEIVRPVALELSSLLGDSGTMILLSGIAFLFLSLRYMVKLLGILLSSKAEEVLHRTLFRSPVATVLAGIAITVMVQSSSITTSVMVPLMGAGIVTLEQAFPFVIGANIGTTVTAMLAALVLGNAAAVSVAFAHLIFNLTGSVIIYGIPPIRAVPLAMARWMGNVATRNRALAIFYIVLAFLGLPCLLLFLLGDLGQ
jgi:sodium-dependent phosphate cotransporter